MVITRFGGASQSTLTCAYKAFQHFTMPCFYPLHLFKSLKGSENQRPPLVLHCLLTYGMVQESAASPGNSLEMQKLRPNPDLFNSIWFNSIIILRPSSWSCGQSRLNCAGVSLFSKLRQNWSRKHCQISYKGEWRPLLQKASLLKAWSTDQEHAHPWEVIRNEEFKSTEPNLHLNKISRYFTELGFSWHKPCIRD